jgi:two-component system NtrC family response regulator
MQSILIVDDDINLCKVLSEELNEVGFDTNYIVKGEEVAEYLKKKKTDLILLDLKMPDKDGLYVLKEINHQPNAHPKVIVLTAYGDVESAILSAKIGVSDFISKPYEFDDLLNTIRKVLQEKK